MKAIRALSVRDTPQAYETIRALMLGSEKDSIRLAAAIAILKIAGVRMDGNVTVNLPPLTPIRPTTPTAELLAMTGTGSATNSGGEES